MCNAFYSSDVLSPLFTWTHEFLTQIDVAVMKEGHNKSFIRWCLSNSTVHVHEQGRDASSNLSIIILISYLTYMHVHMYIYLHVHCIYTCMYITCTCVYTCSSCADYSFLKITNRPLFEGGHYFACLTIVILYYGKKNGFDVYYM